MLAQMIAFLRQTLGDDYIKQFDVRILRQQTQEISLAGTTPSTALKYLLPYDNILQDALIVDIRVPVATTPTTQFAPSGRPLAPTRNAYLTLIHNNEEIVQSLPLQLLSSAASDGTTYYQGNSMPYTLGPLRIDTQQKSYVQFGDVTGVANTQSLLLNIMYFRKGGC
jgi:hypothetical protein